LKLKNHLFKKIENISIEGGIVSIREFLFESVITIFFILGFIAVVMGGFEVYLQGKWEVVFVYICAYLPILICFFFQKRIPYHYLTSIVLLDIYILSILILAGVGLSGAGISLLITFCVLTTTFLGIKRGLVSILMSVTAILLIGLNMSAGVLPIDIIAMTNSTRIEAWLMAAILFLFMGSIMVVCLGILQNSLQRTIQIIQEKTLELQDSNTQLKKAFKEKQKTEYELKKSEERYREYFEENISGTYISNPEGQLTACNQEYKRIFGFVNAQHAMSTSMSEIYRNPSERIEFLECLKKGKRVTGSEPQLKKVDGTSVHVLENASGVFDETGNLKFIRGFLLDITEQRKLEAQLQQAQKMESIGTLAGGIAHDFNNILFPIVGHTEMLLEDVPEDSPHRNNLKEIYNSSLRAKDLVKQILTFSRQDTNELKLMKMQPIIKEALKLIRSTIPTTIEIKQNLQSDCGVIKADPTQIHQIIMNLSTNAYHAMEDTGGELVVSLKEIELGALDLINQDMTPGAYACLTIVDTGKGMNKTLIDKIFDPFFTTKEKGKGTGMGLSVVHGIIKSNGGAIQVYSEPAKGTEFKVYLPVIKSSSKKLEIHQMKEPIQGGIERILLVDDEDAVVTMEKLMLERLGYQVTSRTSSIDALEAFRANPNKFDLVITDMAMPNMPGDKFAFELTKIRPDIPVLLCTGFSEAMSEEKAVSLGIKGFLLKPIVMKDLSHKIREVLDEN
jgi:PAS domain S-box-containing protein